VIKNKNKMNDLQPM